MNYLLFLSLLAVNYAVPCSPNKQNCKDCDNESQKCIECTSPDLYLHDSGCFNANYCPIKTYPDSNTGTNKYEDCDTSCISCKGDGPNMCTRCEDSKYLNDIGNSEINVGTCVNESGCPEKSFPDRVSKKCKSCHSDCETCIGENENQCTSCPNKSVGERKSLHGTPGIGVGKCKDCDASCELCIAEGEDKCTLCLDNNKYLDHGGGDSGKCVVSCPTKTYGLPDNSSEFDEYVKECYQCNSSCERCAGINSNECVQCRDKKQFLRILNTDGGYGECVDVCPEEYFGNLTTMKCDDCNTACKRCVGNGENDCKECKNILYYLDDNGTDVGKCVDSANCSPMTYPDDSGDIKKCTKCDIDCSICTGPNPDNCKACRSDSEYLFVLDITKGTGNCVDPRDCPDNTFPDDSKTPKECTLCHEDCEECTDAGESNCTECAKTDDGNIMYLDTGSATGKQGICVLPENCRETSFPGELDGINICIECDSSCTSCVGSGPSNCTACSEENKYLNKSEGDVGNCVNSDECPDGTFADDINTPKACSQCNSTCKTCTGEETNCIICANNHIKDNPVSKESTCTSCGNKRYAEDNQCKDCETSCAKCSGGTSFDCTACEVEDEYLNITETGSGNCVKAESCPRKTFANNRVDPRQCIKCHEDCEKCQDVGNDACEICANEYLFIDATEIDEPGRCVVARDCQSGKYANRSVTPRRCLPCFNRNVCARCTGSGEKKCISCKDPLWTYNGECHYNMPVNATCINRICFDISFGNYLISGMAILITILIFL